LRSLPPSTASPARISAAIEFATWLRTGNGVAHSCFNLVKIGSTAIETALLDRTVILNEACAPGIVEDKTIRSLGRLLRLTLLIIVDGKIYEEEEVEENSLESRKK
jgi:hypothetical protein